MQAEPKRPLSVVLCGALIQLAGHLVPAAQRPEWKQEWLAEIWHRWQFLHYAGAWSRAEGLRLLRRCLGAFADASWHFTAQYDVQTRIRECIRSPWTCLSAWGAAILVVAVLSSGLPAARGLFNQATHNASGRLLFIWLHPILTGGDKGLPPDVAPAWTRYSHLLEGAAGFAIARQHVKTPGTMASRVLTIRTDPDFFTVLEASPVVGSIPRETGLVLTDSIWQSLFHRDPHVVGRSLQIGAESHRVAGVLNRRFQFLSRQPAIYIIEPHPPATSMMVVARVRPNVSEKALDRELTRIAEVTCYDFFQSQLRYGFLDEAAWIPVQIFTVSVLVCTLLLIAVSGIRIRHLRAALTYPDRAALARRSAFWLAKTALALGFVFLAGLEWSRSQSAILYGSKDPANGPFMLWLYVLGSMAVLFWSVADQRARCRICLRLLCFPVRIGCPGCLLLDWSGTELLCTEGHGVLHVPHLAASWDEESDRWITLDESWKDLFAASGSGHADT
ncbi:MAG: ABC transporter permease [Acidobacteriaceae bacterium]|nr:ABC transporter permease [Acidobacteriaceae bacterium]